ncbi:MAG: NfeD family protein [Thermoplasmata archaeon]|nr:MAG: NfeD family protein [Thermoplasmata archaeon]
MSIYLIIAIICMILLVATVIMGDFGGDVDMDVDMDMDMDMGHFEVGHGDFGGAGISPLSLPIILTFGTGFGGFGTLFEAINMHPLVIPFLSAGLSGLMAGAMYFIMLKVFGQTQTSSTVRLQDLVGKEGIVSIPIKPDGLGQIIVTTEERGRTTLTAVSDQEISTDSVVTITKITGDAVFVKKRL